MQFELNEELCAFRNMAGEFARSHLEPNASAWDQQAKFPVEILKEAAALGMAGMFAQADMGGSGLSRLAGAVIFEQLATGCVTTSAYLSIHNMVTGVIDRYVALVKPESVGLSLTAHLNVRLEKHTESHKRNPMDLFRASVHAWPEVVECVALTGEMDYFLRVVVQDMAHYSRFVMDTLLKHASVQDCKTSFVLDRVKATTALPV